MGKTKVICFANNKGGSGKSTTCSNVGYGLTQLGKKVLLIDGDMQLNQMCIRDRLYVPQKVHHNHSQNPFHKQKTISGPAKSAALPP